MGMTLKGVYAIWETYVMKATFNTLCSLALLVSCGSVMGQDSFADQSGYDTKSLESQVYRGLASFAAGDGHAVDPKSIEININDHGMTAIVPYYTDMLDIDLSTDFMMGAVYFEASRTSTSTLGTGHYTLLLSETADRQVEFQLQDARGRIVHSMPATIEFMGGSGYEAVEASVRATGEADSSLETSVHGACWITYTDGSTSHHSRCWVTIEPIEGPIAAP